MNRKETIRLIMFQVSNEILEDMNKKDNYFSHDKVTRSKPYFEWDINCGDCEEWAITVINRLKVLGIVAYDRSSNRDAYGGHVWVQIGKLHYDPECLEGTSRYADLPLFARNKNFTREQTRQFSLFK